MEYTVQGLNKLSKEINDFVIGIGFDNNDVPLRIALIHSEVSEAFEAYRKNKLADGHQMNSAYSTWKEWFEKHYKDTFEDEIADSIIRLLDLCGNLNIDIETHIQFKMDYNATRGHRYGGKKF